MKSEETMSDEMIVSVQLSLSQETLLAIEEARLQWGLASRSEVIQRLINKVFSEQNLLAGLSRPDDQEPEG
jgi:metal-responsive CopG/Arc/MetJ family transcriptional regulator